MNLTVLTDAALRHAANLVVGLQDATGGDVSGAEGTESAQPAGPSMTDDPIGWFENLDWQMVTTNYIVPAVKVLILLFVAWLIASWAKKVTFKVLTKARFDETLARFFASMARWGVLLLAFIAILSIFGIETASFAVVLGSAGLAIGLAFQGTLGNMAAGVMLLVFRPFKVGDVVNAAGVVGKVTEIELFTTAIDTFDNRRLIVPNGDIFGATIENVTHHPTRRADVEVGVAYSADIDQTREVLTAAAEAINVDSCGEAAVVLTNLGGSAVEWAVRVWCPAADFWPTKQALLREVKMRLDAADIGIPFPQMDVHLDGVLKREGD